VGIGERLPGDRAGLEGVARLLLRDDALVDGGEELRRIRLELAGALVAAEAVSRPSCWNTTGSPMLPSFPFATAQVSWG
jgi:hypothetical protein